jgi:predicted RNase H-like HicB family nuclease
MDNMGRRLAMKQQFLVVYEFANGSYSGYAPDLPGCVSAGDTHEKMRKSMRKVVKTHVKLLVAEGNEVPCSVSHTVHCPKPVEETDVKHWIIERLEIEVPVSKHAIESKAP